MWLSPKRRFNLIAAIIAVIVLAATLSIRGCFSSSTKSAGKLNARDKHRLDSISQGKVTIIAQKDSETMSYSLDVFEYSVFTITK